MDDGENDLMKEAGRK